MDSLKGKKILIFQQRGWGRRIGRFLAKKLYAEGCGLAAVTFQKTTHELIANQPDVKYDLIINNDEVMGQPKEYLRGDVFSLGEICQELGIDSIWPLVMTLRNHVRSYRDKYYYGFKQNVSDEEIVDFVMAVYKYIKVIQREFNPDLIISPNFVSLPHIMFNTFFAKRGIPMIAVTDVKIKGIHIFTHSYQDDRGAFYERVEALNNRIEETSTRERARQYIREFRSAFKQPDHAVVVDKPLSLWKRIRGELRPYHLIYRWYREPQVNVLESTGITIDHRPPRIILRDHYCAKRYKKFADNFPYYPLKKIARFVYFPLQFQPEASLDVTAPFFNNQIEVARQIAMSLPDDYALVVKEHPAMVGLRPSSYLQKVARTPNVKLIDYRISSEKVLERADVVVSPNSTTLAEAAFLCKPAIQLGDLGTTAKLPNVVKHSDMKTLHSLIKNLLTMNCKSEEYERRLENYVSAAFDTGFDFDYVTAWEGGEGNMDDLWQIYKSEIMKVLSV